MAEPFYISLLRYYLDGVILTDVMSAQLKGLSHFQLMALLIIKALMHII